MTRRTKDVAVVGSINADTTYQLAHLPVPGETLLSTSRLDAPGGKGANQAVALATMGIDVDFVAAVGPDDTGRSLLAGLEARGVGTDSVAVVDRSTGSAVIYVAESGENSIVVHPGANAALSAHHVSDYLANHEPAVVMAQLEIPLETVLASFVASEALAVLNPAPMPPRTALLDQVIAATDILIPNRTELATLAGEPSPQSVSEVIACARKLSFTGSLVVTLGSDGALVFPDGVAGEAIEVPAPAVDAIDTSGAGDAFCAALVAGLRRGKDLVEAAQFAVEFAAWTVTQRGAQVPEQAPPALTLSV
jgi:ribokinase